MKIYFVDEKLDVFDFEFLFQISFGIKIAKDDHKNALIQIMKFVFQ